MKSNWVTHGLKTIVILGTLLTVADAATSTSSPSAIDAPASFRCNIQFGAHMRLFNSTVDPHSGGSGLMFSLGLAGLKWEGNHRAWGFGIRGVNDQISRRLGPMILVRSPMGSSGSSYFQVAAGAYVHGGGVSPSAFYPAWFLEAEYALSPSFCLSLGVERVEYEYPNDQDPDYGMPISSDLSYTDSSLYLGLKTGQTVNIAITDALVSLLAIPVRALGWSGGESEPETVSKPIDPVSVPSEIFVRAQGGVFVRLSTNVPAQQKESYLITGDVAILRGNRAGSALGIGLHLAHDVNGDRFGPKAIWRRGRGQRGDSYTQVGAGIYLSSKEDDFKPVLPGYFVEIEYGLFTELALLGSVEILPYAERYAGFVPNPDYPWSRKEVYEDGTAVNTFIGAKGGLKTTLVATAVAGIVTLVSQIENPLEF